jgi:hypothetical protein
MKRYELLYADVKGKHLKEKEKKSSIITR